MGDLPYAKTEVNATLLRLARKKPFYQRNLPQLCSFYARGCCTREKSCPYSPSTSETFLSSALFMHAAAVHEERAVLTGMLRMAFFSVDTSFLTIRTIL